MFNALRKGFGLTAKTMFRPAVTTEYPDTKRPVQPRFHGRHVLNRHPDGLEKCVGCELCAWACPADAIYVNGRDNTPEERYSPGDRYGAVYQINYLRCIFCGLCIEACPTRALTMSNEYELAGDSREDLIFTKDQLLAPLPEGATPPPHTDAAVAARGLSYYGGQWGQQPLVSFPGKPVHQPAPGALPLGAHGPEHDPPVAVDVGAGASPSQTHADVDAEADAPGGGQEQTS